jgi:hypothetical protein
MNVKTLITNLLYADSHTTTATGVAWKAGNKFIAFIKWNPKTNLWMIWVAGSISESFKTRALAESALLEHLST